MTRLIGQYAVIVLIAVIGLTLGWVTLVGIDEYEAHLDSQLRALADKQALWDERRPSNYRYIIQRKCFCGGDDTTPYEVVVQDGRTTARYVAGERAMRLNPVPASIVTIDDVFEFARRELKRDVKVVVSLNQRYWFPDRVHSNDGGQDSADGFVVSNFEPLGD